MSSSLRTGVVLALGTALISGVSNVVNKAAGTVVANPVLFTTLKNAVVALCLVGVLLVFRRWKDFRSFDRRTWIRLLLIGLVGGSIPFALFFTGLSMTSALTASFIHKTLFLWVALLAVPLLHERVGRLQLAAFLLLVGGNFALGMGRLTLGKGELLIFGATILWAIEHVVAKKALTNVAPTVVSSARMIVGTLVLFGIAAFQGNLHLIGSLDQQQWQWILVTGVLLLGYVLTWYSALKRAPATLVACLLVPATLITNVLSQIFLDRRITFTDGVSALLVVGACVVLLVAFRIPVRHQYEQRHSTA